MREDLNWFMRPDEKVIFCVEKPDKEKSTPLKHGISTFFAFGSIFILCIICNFFIGILNAVPFAKMLQDNVGFFIGLGVVAALVLLNHRKISQGAAETVTVVTNQRLFEAPPASFVLDKGWDGPNTNTQIVFDEQLKVENTIYLHKPAIVFTRVNDSFDDSDESFSTRNAYYRPPQIEEVYSHIPQFLKICNFAELSRGESPEDFKKRAAKYLEDRKQRVLLERQEGQ